MLETGSGLGVAPTGSGKTICLAAIVDRILEAGAANRVLWLQHRLELLDQNSRSFFRWTRGRWGYGIWGGGMANGLDARVLFSMVQTASSKASSAHLGGIDLVIVDEAHHAPADTYRAIIGALGEGSPKLLRLGVTATPARADGRGYEGLFGRIFDQISLEEMVGLDRIVPAKCYVVSTNAETESKLNDDSADLSDIARSIDKEEVSRKIVEKWREHADGRHTVAFCCTIDHARHLSDVFNASGIKADAVSSRDRPADRMRKLRAFDEGEVRVLANASLLTEGWDCQAVQSVILCRPCRSFGSLVQMVGRGLRALDPERYPWSPPKADCVVLDFGGGLLRWGGLSAVYGDGLLAEKENGAKERQVNVCPSCGYLIEGQWRGGTACPSCGWMKPVIPRAPRSPLVPEAWDLVELRTGKRDRWAWTRIGDKWIWVCSPQGGWIIVAYSKDKRGVYCIGVEGGVPVAGVTSVEVVWEEADKVARSAGLRPNADVASTKEAPTEKQIAFLEKLLKAKVVAPLSKYEASCMIAFLINRRALNEVKK